MESYKTKAINEIFTSLEDKVFKNFTIDEKKKGKNKQVRSTGRSVLFINDGKDDKVTFSGRNLVGVKMMNLENINVVDLMNYRNIIIAETAIDKLEATYK